MTSFPELFTKRLLLQDILPADQQFIFEGLSHPDVIEHYGVSFTTFEDTETQMKWYADMRKEGTGISWKIVDRTSGEKMGVISIYYYQPKHKKAELGFWLLPAYWKKGFTTEAIYAVLNYCKEEWKLHRLEAFVENENEASSKTLLKTGFEYEGTMRDCEIKNGKNISLMIYSIIF